MPPDKRPDHSTFASRLSYAMSARGIRAPTLAKKIHITRQGVYKWVKGKTSTLDATALMGICSYLNVRPEWLLHNDGPMYRSPLLQDDERDLIMFYRDLLPEDRQRLRTIAASLVAEIVPRPPKGGRT